MYLEVDTENSDKTKKTTKTFKMSHLSEAPKSNIWLVHACFACLGLSGFNYITGAYNKDIISGKVINSIMLGFCALIY